MLKSRPEPQRPPWVWAFTEALACEADIMQNSGRFEEAAAMLEEHIEMRRVARIQLQEMRYRLQLVDVLVELDRFGRAVESGRMLEPQLKQRLEQRLETMVVAPDSVEAVKEAKHDLDHLHVALARAYEGLGQVEECLRYHLRAVESIYLRGLRTPGKDSG